MPKIWIVTIQGVFLDAFMSRDLVMGSVDMTYQSVPKPTIVRENESQIKWDNGLEAKLMSISDRVNHL